MSCYSAVKILSYFLNFIFTVLGIGIVGIAVLCLVCRENLAIDLPPELIYGAIGVGIVIFFIGITSCIGAAKGSSCILITCSIFMLILAVVKITIIILIFKNKDMVKEGMRVLVSEPNNHRSNDTLATGAFHLFEYMGGCCGTTGPASYDSTTLVPSSCCPVGFSKPEKTCDIKDAYITGCQELGAMEKALGTLLWIAYGAMILAVLEIMVLFSSLYLGCTTDEKYGYHEYD